jgi:putative ABC transport system substrate-binding protein
MNVLSGPIWAKHSANGGLIVLPDVTTTNHRDLMVALAARYRLPAVYPFRFFAASGGLMSYGASTIDPFRRAAGYVDRILKGEKPGAPPSFEMTRVQLGRDHRGEFHGEKFAPC